MKSRDADQARIRHRRRRLLPRQGAHRLQPGQPAEVARTARDDAEAGPLPQRGSGHDEPVPARRGLRDQRRRRDRSRHRSLRAVPRHRPQPDRQRDHRAGLLDASSPRSAAATTSATPCRSSRTSPTRSRTASSRWAGPDDRRGDHRDRRHRRRHRVAAVPRGRPPDAPRDRARQLLLHPRLPGALHRAVGRAEDQAHPALGGRAPLDRHPARRDRVPLRPRPARGASSARSR